MWVLLLNLSICTGCSAGDDPATVAIIEEHLPRRNIGRGRVDKNGVRRITRVNIVDARSAAAIFPHLRKLEFLDELLIGWEGMKDRDIESLPPLPNLKRLVLGREGITDEGLKYLAGMKGLNELRLSQTKVVGPGLAHLKGFDQLQWLDLGSTPLNNTAMPHIAANFPRLRRLDMLGTHITPEGLMRLVDLHWLDTVGPPDDLVGPDISQARNRDEQRRLLEERRQARIAFYGEFSRRHIASKQKARAAGMDVPPDDVGPFGYEWSQYQKQQRLGKP